MRKDAPIFLAVQSTLSDNQFVLVGDFSTDPQPEYIAKIADCTPEQSAKSFGFAIAKLEHMAMVIRDNIKKNGDKDGAQEFEAHFENARKSHIRKVGDDE